MNPGSPLRIADLRERHWLRCTYRWEARNEVDGSEFSVWVGTTWFVDWPQGDTVSLAAPHAPLVIRITEPELQAYFELA